jgi:hypothetical protein
VTNLLEKLNAIDIGSTYTEASVTQMNHYWNNNLKNMEVYMNSLINWLAYHPGGIIYGIVSKGGSDSTPGDLKSMAAFVREKILPFETIVEQAEKRSVQVVDNIENYIADL